MLRVKLRALGVAVASDDLQFDAEPLRTLMHTYHVLGNVIAHQYAGSNLVNTMSTYRKRVTGDSAILRKICQGMDMLNNIKRYYSNSFTGAQPVVCRYFYSNEQTR